MANGRSKVIPPVYAVLLLAVILLTLGQLLQKVAVDSCTGVQPASRLITNLLRRPAMWGALLCLGGGLSAWLVVLSSLDVSKAFPFLSLGQVTVLLVARFYFHEHLSRARWIGALMILSGVGLIAGT